MNNHEGQRLVPKIAEQLIIELFAGQTAQLQEIKAKVEEVHTERGGLPPTVRYSPVSSALSMMKESELADNPTIGFWSIYSFIRTLDDFNKWANSFEEGQYVFRGVPNEVYKIQASAYRRPDENERDFEKFLRINQDLIREAKQRGYNKKDGMAWNELDILAELQHFRAATCLIDFTYSAQIALWFACQPDRKKQEEKEETEESDERKEPIKSPNGKVYAVKHKPPESRRFIEIITELLEEETQEEKKKIEFYLKEGDEAKLYYLQPKLQNHRIIAQQSVFLFGKYEFDEDAYCLIDTACKKNLLKELHKVSNITEDKLFPDFEGFAWVNREEAPLPESTPSILKVRGRRAFDNENYDDAIGDFSRSIEKDPNDVEAYNLRGRTYTQKDNYEKALSDFDEAINLKSDYAEVYFNRGQLYRNQEEYDKAIVDFDKVISLQPENAEAYYMRGRTKYNLRDYRAAEVDFHQATNLDPNYGEAFFYRGISKYNFEQYEESLEHFDEAIRLKYDNARVYCLRGAVKNRLGQYELAAVDLSESINLDNTLIFSHYERAVAWYNLRRFTQAQEDLIVALDLVYQHDDVEMLNRIEDLLNDINSRTVGRSQDEE